MGIAIGSVREDSRDHGQTSTDVTTSDDYQLSTRFLGVPIQDWNTTELQISVLR